MNGLKSMLLAEQFKLEQIIQMLKIRLNNAPEGSLRLSKSQNYTQYYHSTKKNKKSIYIAKSNKDLIQKLTEDYEDDEIAKVHLKEHVERQKFIKPVEPTWEQRLKEWKDKEYKGKEFQEGVPVILTERGERVRSKSEKIMADYFFRRGIEYKYG